MAETYVGNRRFYFHPQQSSPSFISILTLTTSILSHRSPQLPPKAKHWIFVGKNFSNLSEAGTHFHDNLSMRSSFSFKRKWSVTVLQKSKCSYIQSSPVSCTIQFCPSPTGKSLVKPDIQSTRGVFFYVIMLYKSTFTYLLDKVCLVFSCPSSEGWPHYELSFSFQFCCLKPAGPFPYSLVSTLWCSSTTLFLVVIWRSGSALVSINPVNLHRAG